MQVQSLMGAKAFLAVMVAWITAQAFKVIRGFIVEKRFNFKYFLLAGGMPSSHSAVVMALSTAAGIYEGFDSIIFLVTLVFSIITMFDAAGVRRAVGRQAVLLNKIIDELYEGGQVKEERLKALLGHTPFEVFAGAVWGVIVGLIVCH
ncbi:MAG: divergent PAP2 family protein [Candidatus Omnitrophica bacterium]|nr:divergent PAP2 family protein [Candidatus Omnitrophota bacterium]